MATFDHGYALLIGVGTHHNPAYSLPFAANDAHALQRILSDPRWCAYPAAHIRLLCDEAATTAAVLDGFVWLATCAHRDPQATIVVYYSGHIGRNEETDTYCLLPYDETAATSRLSTTTLRAALNAIPSNRHYNTYPEYHRINHTYLVKNNDVHHTIIRWIMGIEMGNLAKF